MCDDSTSTVSATCLSEAESSQLLMAVDRQLAVGRLRADPTESRLSVVLEDRALWTQFHRLTNEMIVTKHGRYDGLTIRYDTRCYFNVRSKADTSRLNLPHGTDN